MSDRTFPLAIDAVAVPVDVKPGNEIHLKGSFHSPDGATIDAATTTWPAETPGGAGVDPGGLVDFKGGGFHVTSRDPVTHEVIAVATGEAAPACAAAGVSAPCLPLRTMTLARTRLVTRDELKNSMKGQISVELVVPPEPPPPSAIAPVRDAMTSPLALGAFGVLGLAGVCALGWVVHRRQKNSPEGKMKELVARVAKKLKRADTELFAALEPVVGKTLTALRERRVDARSKEGIRVAQLLARVESRLDETVEETRAKREQAAADELVLEMESALEAARETASL